MVIFSPYIYIKICFVNHHPKASFGKMSIRICSTSNIKLHFNLIILSIYLMYLFSVSHCLQAQQNQEHGLEQQGGIQTNQCSNKCDNLQIPFPFYLNASSIYSCGGSSVQIISDAFGLSCVEQDSSLQTVYLNIDSQRYKVIKIDNFGVKLELAIPRNSSKAQCSVNAYTINATLAQSGIRCQCPIELVGDAFVHELGCSKSCLKDGREVFGKDCITAKRYHTRKVKVLIGVFASALTLASLIVIFCLLKRSANKKPTASLDDQYNEGGNTPSGKISKARLFSYGELEQATSGFDNSKKLVEGTKGELYAGVLEDGSHVAVHRLQNLIEEKDSVSQSVEVLSAVPHRNLAHVLGYCIDSSLLVVYEYPNYGTLEKHLIRRSGVGFEWGTRLKIASESAGLLSFLQNNICPPIIHQDLNPGFIFVDCDCSIKVAGFIPYNEYVSDNNSNNGQGEGATLQFSTNDDVYSMGLLLADLISGLGEKCLPTKTALEKIQSGKVEEIVDPLIYYDEHKEEIEVVAELATKCLLFGNKLGMKNVAKELMNLLSKSTNATNLGLGGSTSSNTREATKLEETFSNSSLLQMMSMSPDSIYAPHYPV